MNKKLSVVIPAYNEANRIARTLNEVACFLRGADYHFEILVVDDGSRDATQDVVRKLQTDHKEIRLIALKPNRGKGEAVKEGIRQAAFEICLFMDADNSTSINEWPKFEAAFNEGADVVSASRHLHASRILTPQPFMRRWLGAGYRVLCCKLFGLTNSDFNCGFKAFKTPLAQRVYKQARMRDWTFDVEIFCLLKPLQPKLKEIPVAWVHEDKDGGIAPIRTALKTFSSLLELKKRF